VLSPLVLLPVLRLLRLDLALLAVSLAATELPFGAYRGLGLPVGRRGDWFGFALPNALGWTLILLTDLVALYLLGCAASAAWTRAGRRRGAPAPPRRWRPGPPAVGGGASPGQGSRAPAPGRRPETGPDAGPLLRAPSEALR
jgi:hypothetical protein